MIPFILVLTNSVPDKIVDHENFKLVNRKYNPKDRKALKRLLTKFFKNGNSILLAFEKILMEEYEMEKNLSNTVQKI